VSSPSKTPSQTPALTVGLIGFGAFGRLIARHLAPHARVLAHDPFVADAAIGPDAEPAGLAAAAACPVVILATPVSALRETARALAPHLRPGALVADVGSVKVVPAAILREELPAHVEILATHPLFGPQSARDGIRGLKVAVCPIRGRQGPRTAAFLRRVLGLEVVLTAPEAHDRAMAVVQGLTHLIAKVLVRMEPLPGRSGGRRMTTRSFDGIMAAVDMVRHDAPEVFSAIERQNPFAPEVRRRFFALAAELEGELDADRRPAPRLAAMR
jgi:prephenate dehydrogenase